MIGFNFEKKMAKYLHSGPAEHSQGTRLEAEQNPI